MTQETVFQDQQDFIQQYQASCIASFGSKFEDLNRQQRYFALAKLVAMRSRTIQAQAPLKEKKVYYFSLEFLLGPLLDNYLINLGVRDLVEAGVSSMGEDLDLLCAQEADPGLGNGGLGRLAACFLDSMAHEGMAGFGIGMRYRYGLFRQKIEGGRQVETTDNWLAGGYPWETRVDGDEVIVQFGGHVIRHEDADGRYWFTQEGGQKVRAVPYDVPVVGFGGKTVNKLRLWSAEPYAEDFDLEAFNEGDYAQANKFRTDVEAISTILYPNDSGPHGQMLRLKQEYLFVSAGLHSILDVYRRDYGDDWGRLGDHVCVHTNDTHPAMCGPELMRILVDEKGVPFDEAFAIAKKTISFTNHTVMPEALEKWPIDTFKALLPRLYMIIEAIDHRWREQLTHEGAWTDALRNTAILWDGQVRMANLSVIFSHSVNGVSALHTSILERSVFQDFYRIEPKKFNNKTNGVSHRRFLCEANRPYAKLITEAIGTRWMDDAMELEKLVPFENDPAFLDAMTASKRTDKQRLAALVKNTTGIQLDCDMVFDVQVKRFHSYKRQLLNCLKIMEIYNRIVDDPTYSPVPTAFVFSGKAAQSYTFAKEVIRLIHSIADVVNNDPRCANKIRVAFVPNFAVSNAQVIYAATDISEQISVAGAEASGTSNMKLMMNAAITLGTLDGSNVEISELVGADNIKIFGLHADEVEALRSSGTYYAWDMCNADRDHLGRIVYQLTDGTLQRLSGNFESIYENLMIDNDRDLVLRDFHSYMKAWDELTASHSDRARWNASALHNTAKAGYFSSDRTIREYMRDVWHI